MVYTSTIIPNKAPTFPIPHIWKPDGDTPVVTTDEVATEIQVDDRGAVTGFTSLTDKLATFAPASHTHSNYAIMAA